MKIIFLLLFLVSIKIPKAQAMDDSLLSPKLRAFLVVSGYGAAGGALLGLASLAFGQDGKAIARGASLGLYTGMVLGAYIIFTHDQYEKGIYQEQGPSKYDSEEFSTRLRYIEGQVDSTHLLSEFQGVRANLLHFSF
jgi:hypothetical protein